MDALRPSFEVICAADRHGTIPGWRSTTVR